MRWYAEIVGGPDRYKLEKEVSLDSAEESEREEEDNNMIKTFDEVGGSMDCMFISNNTFGPLMEAMGTVYCEEAH